MDSQLRQICNFSNQFLYPEINKHLQEIIKKDLDCAEVNLETLYTKNTPTFHQNVQILALKIFHHLKMTFSVSYSKRFTKAVSVLASSEDRLKAVLVLQKVGRQYIAKEQLIKLKTERLEKERIEKAKWDKAIEVCKRARRMGKIQGQFVILRDQLRNDQKTLDHEITALYLLTQYHEGILNLQELNAKKNKGWKAFFRKESAQNQTSRKNTLQLLEKLNLQLYRHSSRDFKVDLEKEENLQPLLDTIDQAKMVHDSNAQHCEMRVQAIKAKIYALHDIK